jgi:hypothetical protein
MNIKFPYRHFPNAETAIAVHETGPRGISVERRQGGPKPICLIQHNGCGRGNMLTKMTKAESRELGITLIALGECEA